MLKKKPTSIVALLFSVLLGTAINMPSWAVDKAQVYTEMLQLAKEIKALKSLINTDSSVADAYATLLERYSELSHQMGGDDPILAT